MTQYIEWRYTQVLSQKHAVKKFDDVENINHLLSSVKKLTKLYTGVVLLPLEEPHMRYSECLSLYLLEVLYRYTPKGRYKLTMVLSR